MVIYSEQSSSEACVSACDKDFIACAESGRTDCLDRFRNCDRACKE